MKKRIRKEADSRSTAPQPRAPEAEDRRATVHNSPMMSVQRQVLSDQFGQAAQLSDEKSQKPNRTGLPDKLKSGVENLSGISMDSVRVHYNSGKPAQLNAAAYAQGSNIHLGPGQERHLPHEAWHVVQQAQGRVQPTAQMAGGKKINDERHLETEADVMGRKAELAGQNYAPTDVIEDRAEFQGPVQGRFGLEKETRIGVDCPGKTLSNQTIAKFTDFRIDIDKDPSTKLPILEMVIEHFDETEGEEEGPIVTELTRRVGLAWEWADKVRKLDPGKKLNTVVAGLRTGYENMQRGRGKSMHGVIHITVGVGMADAPKMFQYLQREGLGGWSSWPGLQRIKDALSIGAEFDKALSRRKDIVDATKTELVGFMTFAANQILTFNDRMYIKKNKLKAGQPKNLFLALGRVPLNTIHASLSRESRVILEGWTVDEISEMFGEKYTPWKYGADNEGSTWGKTDTVDLDNKLIELAFHGKGTFDVQELIGGTTIVHEMNPREGGGQVAATELRSIAAGFYDIDEQNETKDGLIEKATRIIRQSRAHWPGGA